MGWQPCPRAVQGLTNEQPSPCLRAGRVDSHHLVIGRKKYLVSFLTFGKSVVYLGILNAATRRRKPPPWTTLLPAQRFTTSFVWSILVVLKPSPTGTGTRLLPHGKTLSRASRPRRSASTSGVGTGVSPCPRRTGTRSATNLNGPHRPNRSLPPPPGGC